MKSHNDEQSHDENLAIDRIKSDPNYFFKYAKNSPRRVLRLALCKIHMGI